MGKIVWLEAYRGNRIEKMRHEALMGFPWGKLSKMVDEILAPTTRLLTPQQQYVAEEAVYRLAFEAYLTGMESSRRGERECPPGRPEKDRRHWFHRVYRDSGNQLMGQVAQDLDLFRYLDEWTIQSVLAFMEEVGIKWFIQGVDEGIRLRRRGTL